MSNEIGVGIVGTKFMGRAHSNAFVNVAYWFDLPARPAMRAACGRNAAELAAFAQRFGWQAWEHTFIHEVRDLLIAISKDGAVYPNFYDGLRCQQVLDAALESAIEDRWVGVPEV